MLDITNNFDDYFSWIKLNLSDVKYYKIKTDLIDQVYSSLEINDRNFLTDYLVRLINFMYNKLIGPRFDSLSVEDKSSNIFWNQLIQNNMLDLRALLNMLLPYISETDNFDGKKAKLRSLKDLYISKDPITGKYIYTNMQYNRCIRFFNNDNSVGYKERPFEIDYFEHHFKLLLMSIELSANKLYVNWVDILPMRMDEYTTSALYLQTEEKITKKNNLLFTHLDPNPGLSFNDIYNTIVNHLYYQILEQKWLIFDLPINGKMVGLLSYLGEKLDLKQIWDNKLWFNTKQSDMNKFKMEWDKLKLSTEYFDKVCVYYIYDSFAINHQNKARLIKEGLLISKKESKLVNDEDTKISEESLNKGIFAINKVPAEQIYLFLFDQLNLYKKSWYYYASDIKNKEKKDSTLISNEIDSFEDPVVGKISITPKNFYNFAKSLVHYGENFIGFPKHWQSLSQAMINEIMSRLFGPIQTEKRWFNIPFYIARAYGKNLTREDTTRINIKMEELIKKHLVNVIFESLIYHGTLSKFVPQKEITDMKIIDSAVGSTGDENKRRVEQQLRVKKNILNEKNKKLYGSNAYYYATSQTFNSLGPLTDKKYPNYSQSYFDSLITDQFWIFTYAMNWVSQINFFHHYCNCRVLFVTGATGVGKSTEIPKLLLYCTYMIDYKLTGKVVCTIPRIGPVVDVADNVSKNMGLPILGYDAKYEEKIPTNNYVVQYKHSKGSHVNKGQQSYLRFVTDGLLLEEIKKSPFLTKTREKNSIEKEYLSGNKYDVVIVDEAHEHNTPMDLILTLMQCASYINNSLHLVIISATMEDDEQIYRRYYRKINDNRAYPLSSYIQINELDRANMDRRVDISKPRETTQYKITDHWLTKRESDKITPKNFLEYAIAKTIEVLEKTSVGHLLLFVTGKNEIDKCAKEINANTPNNIICFKYHGEISVEQRTLVAKINEQLPFYTESKIPDGPPVKPGTYTRAVIIATNAAEASITVSGLRYIVDSGYVKVNVYDPIIQMEELITMPISYTSSRQRRGRVGRVAPGDVYYLYDEAKVINNKTSYKITEENIMDTLVDLLKSEPSDYPIITRENDINNLFELSKFKKNTITKKDNLPNNKSYLMYSLFMNIGIYLDIIIKQYMLMEDSDNISDYSNFYYYYGKGNITDNKNFQTTNYLINNHDDYHYQAEIGIKSRCHTGFDSDVLEDPTSELDFYIIHPDENVIIRDLFTGKMIGIKQSQSVSERYYYQLMKLNDLLGEKIDPSKINFYSFTLLKYDLFMEQAKLLLLVIELEKGMFSPLINLETEKNEQIKHILTSYYDNINKEYSSSVKRILIRSAISIDIHEIKSITVGKISAFDDFYNLLWYLYAIPYGMSDDVLAISYLLSMGMNYASFMPNPNKNTATQFILAEQNDKGDIYYFWKLWMSIKKELITYNLLSDLEINDGMKIQFEISKNNYKNKSEPDVKSYIAYDQMHKLGILDSKDEFYHRVKSISANTKNESVIQTVSSHIAKKHSLDPNVIEKFITKYLSSAFETKKIIWLYENDIEYDDENMNKANVVDNIIKKFNMNKIFSSDNLPIQSQKWNTILETYLRSHSPNLVRVLSPMYISVNSGFIFEKESWNKYFKAETTLLNQKTKYIIYHNELSKIVNDEKISNIHYLTPVKLEWIIKLNPIYYYYFIRNKKEFLDNFQRDTIQDNELGYPFIKRINEIVSDVTNAFDQNYLISFLNQLNDKVLSMVVISDLQKKLI